MPKIPEGQIETLSTHLEQYPALRPFAGLVFEAYMSRVDIGSGLRVFMVYQVGHKWIHLFYAPQLHAFRLRPSEFAGVFKRPIPDLQFDATKYLKRVSAKVAEANRFGYQFSEAVISRVERLSPSNGIEAFKQAAKKPLRIKTVRT